MASSTEPRVQPSAPPSIDARAMLHFTLYFGGFLASTLLMTWGLFALFFLALGGFSLDGLMNQLNNLSTRYVIRSEEHTSELQSH